MKVWKSLFSFSLCVFFSPLWVWPHQRSLGSSSAVPTVLPEPLRPGRPSPSSLRQHHPRPLDKVNKSPCWEACAPGKLARMRLTAEQMSPPCINTRPSTRGTQHLPLHHQEDDHNKSPASLYSHSRRGPAFFSVDADNGWKYGGLAVWCGFLFLSSAGFHVGNVWSERSAAPNRNQATDKGMKRSGPNPQLSIGGSNILAFVLRNMTFNPDWHPENGWTGKHAPFIIQSAPELSTWINKSGSYLLKQNWISSPTGSGWRKLSAPLFWFVSASYRDRILFFSAIQPPALGSPETPFPMCCVRPIGPETTCTAQHPSFPVYGVCSPGIFQLLINPNLRAGGGKASRLRVRFIYRRRPTADCIRMCLLLGVSTPETF